MPTLLTYPLRKDLLQRLLSERSQHPRAALQLTAEERRSIGEWAIEAGLMQGQELTAAGNLVATRDPYLEATVTDWLIHGNLCFSDRSLFQYFVYTFLPNHAKFTQDELLKSCTATFAAKVPEQLSEAVRSLLQTYTDTEAIAKNQFLTQQKKQYLIGRADLTNPYTVGYLLAKVWERDFPSQSSVLVEQITRAERGLTAILGITEAQLRQQLDVLAQQEIIEQRSAQPHLAGTKPPVKAADEVSYQVHRCWETPLELLEKAYDNDIATPNQPLIRSLEGILDDDEDAPDFSRLLEWASRFSLLDGGSHPQINLAS